MSSKTLKWQNLPLWFQYVLSYLLVIWLTDWINKFKSIVYHNQRLTNPLQSMSSWLTSQCASYDAKFTQAVFPNNCKGFSSIKQEEEKEEILKLIWKMMSGTHTLLCCWSDSHGLLFYEVQKSSERMENTIVKGKNNCSVTWDGVGTYSESQKTQGSTPWHFNFVQMTKMTSFKNTVVDHTELIYTHSLQTAFRNTIVFLCSIPYGTQRLVSVFPCAGCRALSPSSIPGTRWSNLPAAQLPQHSHPSKCQGPGGQAAIQGREVMEAGNSYIKMSILSLQPCLIIVHLHSCASHSASRLKWPCTGTSTMC